jgi:hypothetical protein
MMSELERLIKQLERLHTKQALPELKAALDLLRTAHKRTAQQAKPKRRKRAVPRKPTFHDKADWRRALYAKIAADSERLTQ